MTLAEIKTMRATCRAKIEDLLGRTSSREMSTEENQMFTDLKAEGERLGSIESRYAVLESFDKPTAPAIVRPPLIVPSAKENGKAPEAWIDPRTGQSVRVLAPSDRMVDLVEPMIHSDLSLGRCLRGVVTGRWDGAEAERKAMTEGTLGSGGYLLPSPLSSQVIDKVRNVAQVVRAGCRTVPMDAPTLAMARVTADPTCAWHSENGTITASEPTFDRVNFTAQTLASLATMSAELFEDTNVDSVVVDIIAKVLALELDRACLLGTGTAPQPRGIANQSGVAVDSTTFTTNGSVISTAAPAGAVGWDWLGKGIAALWAVNENPNAVIYAPRTASELDLLRATTGEALPPPGSVASLQRLFTNQIPITQTQGTSSDCSSAFIGDFSAAMIGMRRDVVIEVSRTANVGATSLFSTLGVGVRAYLRCDFQLARPAAFRVVQGIR